MGSGGRWGARERRLVLSACTPSTVGLCSPTRSGVRVTRRTPLTWSRRRFWWHGVPPAETARLWLYGVARNVLANQQRSERRRQRLGERLRQELPAALEGAPLTASRTGAVRAALARLGPEDQEILRLAGWEELSPGEIAMVLGISQVAVRSRLHRARRRLRAALERVPEPEDKNPVRLQEAQIGRAHV